MGGPRLRHGAADRAVGLVGAVGEPVAVVPRTAVCLRDLARPAVHVDQVGALGLTTLAYVGLRDADIWTMAGLGAIVLGVGVYQTARGAAMGPGSLLEMFHAGWHRTRRWVLIGVVLLATFVPGGRGRLPSHRNVLNIEEALYVRVFPFPDRVAWFSATACPKPRRSTLRPGAAPATVTNAQVVGIDFTDPKWAALKDWFSNDAMTTYALFLLTHPAYDVSAPFDSPPLTYNNVSGQLSFYLPIGHHPLPVFETVFAPNRFVVLTLALLGLAIGTGRRILRRSEWRFLIVFVVVGVFSMLLAWHGEGMEVTATWSKEMSRSGWVCSSSCSWPCSARHPR